MAAGVALPDSEAIVRLLLRLSDAKEKNRVGRTALRLATHTAGAGATEDGRKLAREKLQNFVDHARELSGAAATVFIFENAFESGPPRIELLVGSDGMEPTSQFFFDRHAKLANARMGEDKQQRADKIHQECVGFIST